MRVLHLYNSVLLHANYPSSAWEYYRESTNSLNADTLGTLRLWTSRNTSLFRPLRIGLEISLVLVYLDLLSKLDINDTTS